MFFLWIWHFSLILTGMLRLGFTCLIFWQVCSSCIYGANVFETSSFQGENSDIYLMLGGYHLKTSFDRKAFQYDAYRPLFTVLGGLFSGGLQSWPPDVTGRGRGLGSLHSEVQCLEGWSLYSEVTCLRGGRTAEGSLYGEVKCIMGNGHMGPPWGWEVMKETLHGKFFKSRTK